MPAGFDRDLEEAKYEDLRVELHVSIRKDMKKMRDRRMTKAAQDLEANPKKSWDHFIDLGGWQGERMCQVPAEIRDVDGTILTGEL